MIALPPSTRIYLACGATDMRKGFDGLAVLTQQVLQQSPHSGALFAFRGKRGDLVKLLWYDGRRWFGGTLPDFMIEAEVGGWMRPRPRPHWTLTLECL